ncbi:ACP S-malonyltransferase [Amphritea balenae]|uniref:[acyl-carrier-protein] S-malonyltransferase n=2 Tax=Amphritea balenae TaxID=452629 RepID=A0A3P1SXI5_9GAMM|nr:ACP S-malonyltransferase [Amphritea balenae]GGK54297.1 acyl carrier protein [Amphritea balenae]
MKQDVNLQGKKQKALVICPGRGTYNKEELGYLNRFHMGQEKDKDKARFVDRIDAYRQQEGQVTVSELDGRESYAMREHTRGDNASPLIHACAYADFLSIDQSQFDVVAVTGNSMGWYIALAAAQALPESSAIELINTMGTMMQQSLIGGQVIYPLVDESWCQIPGRREHLLELMESINQQQGAELHISIELGGMLVFGGNEAALKQLMELLPPLPQQQGRFPLRLHNHAAFHTPLLKKISDHALQRLPSELFAAPSLPLIDGRGHIWQPLSSDTQALHQYTLGHQVFQPYDFSKAIEVSVKEFAPDRIIILGPGSTLGGAVAQALININWQGLSCKEDFIRQQKTDPYVLAMGLEEQRAMVVS